MPPAARRSARAGTAAGTAGPPKPRSTPSPKYTPGVPVRVYELSRTGLSDSRIAEAIGVSVECLTGWKKTHPEVAEAIKAGRTRAHGTPAGGETLKEYIYKHLSPESQRLWEDICDMEDKTSDPHLVGGRPRLLERILEGKGSDVRKELYLHALVMSNFNPSEACRKIGVSRFTLLTWMKEPRFRELVEEMDWHRRNFFEGALNKLVEEGDSQAVIFVNKTVNADRGYMVKKEVTHDHKVSGTVSVRSMNLPLEMRKELLARARAQKALPPKQEEPVIEGEVEE